MQLSLSSLTIAMMLILPLATPTLAEAPSTDWLARPLTTWNQPGAPIPRAPTPQAEPETAERCQEQVRPPTTANDRALVSAGWSLVGPIQVYSGTSTVTAMSGVDGMCRPLGYQLFVFAGNRFAGTLSPTPMDSRRDESSVDVYLVRDNQISVEFNRYKDSVPLCCPSSSQRVTYEVQQQRDIPVVIPTQIDPPLPNS